MSSKEVLKHLIDKESTNFQCNNLLLNLAMLISLIILTLLRGPGNKNSVIGVKRCDKLDWVLLALLFIISIMLTLTAVLI